MSTDTANVTPIAIPAEVRAFAAKHQVDGYLPSVLDTARKLFPDAMIRVVLEDDPEIENDTHIVVLASGVALDVEQTLACYDEYHRALFSFVPAPVICTFRLGLENLP